MYCISFYGLFSLTVSYAFMLFTGIALSVFIWSTVCLLMLSACHCLCLSIMSLWSIGLSLLCVLWHQNFPMGINKVSICLSLHSSVCLWKKESGGKPTAHGEWMSLASSLPCINAKSSSLHGVGTMSPLSHRLFVLFSNISNDQLIFLVKCSKLSNERPTLYKFDTITKPPWNETAFYQVSVF